MFGSKNKMSVPSLYKVLVWAAEGKEYPSRHCPSILLPMFFFFFFFLFLQTFRRLISLACSPRLPPFVLPLLDHEVIFNNLKARSEPLSVICPSCEVVDLVRGRKNPIQNWLTFFFHSSSTVDNKWIYLGDNTFVYFFFQLKFISVATAESLPCSYTM